MTPSIFSPSRLFQQARQHLPQYRSNRPQGHDVCSFVEFSNAVQFALEQKAMSQGTSRKSLGERISAALWHRVNAGRITRRDLRAVLGCSESTIDNLMAGNHQPSSPMIEKLMESMDAAFINEIWAPTGVVVFKLSDARAAAIRRANAALDELNAAGVIG